MTIWVFRNGEWVDKNLAPPLHPIHASAPGIIRDTMEPTLNPANGKRYDSKRAYEKAVRAAGCEIIGNEMPSASPKPVSDPTPDIVQAVEKVMNAPKRRKKRERV